MTKAIWVQLAAYKCKRLFTLYQLLNSLALSYLTRKPHVVRCNKLYHNLCAENQGSIAVDLTWFMNHTELKRISKFSYVKLCRWENFKAKCKITKRKWFNIGCEASPLTTLFTTYRIKISRFDKIFEDCWISSPPVGWSVPQSINT